MYGLDGVQGGCNWERIRGDAIVIRSEPPIVAGGSMNFVMGSSSKTPPVKLDEPHNPIMTVEEMAETLLFFRDHDRSAQHIAQVSLQLLDPPPRNSTTPPLRHSNLATTSSPRRRETLSEYSTTQPTLSRHICHHHPGVWG